MKKLLRISVLALLAAAVAVLPLPLSAQTNTTSTNLTKSATAKKKDAAAKKPAAHPFHGKLAAVDKNAKTITIGTSTYQITSETLIFKDGQPATLGDGVVGEPASGYVKPGADGKLNATKVNFGAKAESKTKAKKAEKTGETTTPEKTAEAPK